MIPGTQFRIVPLNEFLKVYQGKKEYGPLDPKIVRANLKHPNCPKICVEAIGQTVYTMEEIYLLMVSADVAKNQYTGTVNSRTRRSRYHGVEFGDLVHFRVGDVIDIFNVPAYVASLR